MNARLARLCAFLEEQGVGEIRHSHGTYLGHLTAVHRDLASWGCAPEVCEAGLFHSVYGTEVFRRCIVDVDRRGEVAALIGERAERLAYVNCLMARASFDEALQRREPVHRFGSWLSDEVFELGERDFEDVGRIHLCDWLEQLPREGRPEHRRDAYRRLAERLGGPALQAWARACR